MGMAVVISPYGIPVHEAVNGIPVEVSGNGTGTLVRYAYDGTLAGNAKRSGDSTPVRTKTGFPGQTQRPDGTYPPALWTP